ncbi:hypothetical protein M404DRAFT_1005217 [Pisolithus tinctorius Marx 270]|uniref:Uncharacterized protein n=1 Tax=Pisolithus tinctorius Marx 270 TaxID=870435 RepID=A0A0C3NBP1_PISTI|nr:hypothetical protein M404DRAFT_1005217 [Pisolithus tinctorius Marx 270]
MTAFRPGDTRVCGEVGWSTWLASMAAVCYALRLTGRMYSAMVLMCAPGCAPYSGWPTFQAKGYGL